MIKILLLSFMLMFINSCYMPGTVANTSISSNFDRILHKRIAVLPFTCGGTEINYTLADRFSARLMELGFIVVERSQIEAMFYELKLNYSGILSQEKIKMIGKLLNIDTIVFGSITYGYAPESYYSIPMTNWYTGQYMGNVSGGAGASIVLNSISVRAVDVETGEVVIASSCKSIKGDGNSEIDEIAETIAVKLKLRKPAWE